MLEKVITRGSALVVINAFDLGVPALRMVILSRFLDLRELEFVSLLAALYATLEQVTDVAMYKFVLSSPREDYEEALAAAHALSVLRGLIVGLIGVAISPSSPRPFTSERSGGALAPWASSSLCAASSIWSRASPNATIDTDLRRKPSSYQTGLPWPPSWGRDRPETKRQRAHPVVSGLQC